MSCEDRRSRRDQGLPRARLDPRGALQPVARAPHGARGSKRPWARACLLALAGAVLASPAPAAANDAFFEIEPPEGFSPAESLGESVARETAKRSHFGARPADSGAEAYASQGEGALYVWWASGPATEDAAQSIREAFDRVRRAPSKASPQAKSVAIDEWKEDQDENVARADLAWRHLSNETLTLVHTRAFVSSEGMPQIVTAECVMHQEREAEVRPTCEEALSSLSISAPAERRMALGELPEGDPVDVTATDSVPDLATGAGDGELDSELSESGDDGEATADPVGPRMGEPSDGVIYQDPEAEGGQNDGPPWLLILGALLIAGAVYATWRSRQRPEEPGSERDGEDEDEDA